MLFSINMSWNNIYTLKNSTTNNVGFGSWEAEPDTRSDSLINN